MSVLRLLQCQLKLQSLLCVNVSCVNNVDSVTNRYPAVHFNSIILNHNQNVSDCIAYMKVTAAHTPHTGNNIQHTDVFKQEHMTRVSPAHINVLITRQPMNPWKMSEGWHRYRRRSELVCSNNYNWCGKNGKMTCLCWLDMCVNMFVTSGLHLLW